jgi:hypothetical protein
MVRRPGWRRTGVRGCGRGGGLGVSCRRGRAGVGRGHRRGGGLPGAGRRGAGRRGRCGGWLHARARRGGVGCERASAAGALAPGPPEPGVPGSLTGWQASRVMPRNAGSAICFMKLQGVGGQVLQAPSTKEGDVASPGSPTIRRPLFRMAFPIVRVTRLMGRCAPFRRSIALATRVGVGGLCPPGARARGVRDPLRVPLSMSASPRREPEARGMRDPLRVPLSMSASPAGARARGVRDPLRVPLSMSASPAGARARGVRDPLRVPRRSIDRSGCRTCRRSLMALLDQAFFLPWSCRETGGASPWWRARASLMGMGLARKLSGRLA